jgi:hypothetical protein
MIKKTALLAVTLLSACALLPNGSGHPTQVQPVDQRNAVYCHQKSCTVRVAVDANCVVSADPYTLVMGGVAGPITIVWTVSGPGATFAAGDGIAFDPSGNGVFSKAEGGQQSYVFHNSGANGVYHYVVNARQGGRACPTLDPTGVNDM